MLVAWGRHPAAFNHLPRSCGLLHAHPAGWDKPLSDVSPVFSPTTTLLGWMPQVLLHAVHTLRWHMANRPSPDTRTLVQSLLVAQCSALCCLRRVMKEW
jgi:hypothetical protein